MMEIKEAAIRVRELWKALHALQRNPEIKRDAVLQTATQLFLEAACRSIRAALIVA
jgi:hypothetical protein